MMPLPVAPFNQDMLAAFKERVATVKDTSAPVKERIQAIERLHSGTGDRHAKPKHCLASVPSSPTCRIPLLLVQSGASLDRRQCSLVPSKSW
jgi:hypothetical protein